MIIDITFTCPFYVCVYLKGALINSFPRDTDTDYQMIETPDLRIFIEDSGPEDCFPGEGQGHLTLCKLTDLQVKKGD